MPNALHTTIGNFGFAFGFTFLGEVMDFLDPSFWVLDYF